MTQLENKESKSAYKQLDNQTGTRLINKYNEDIANIVEKLMTTEPNDFQEIEILNIQLKGLVQARQFINYRVQHDLNEQPLNKLKPF